jgi:hypothetical protein
MDQPIAVDNKPLVLDLIAWVAERPRPYAEVMEAWRTSCPRLPIWEDAVDLGLVTCAGDVVSATGAGLAFLRAERSGASRDGVARQ